MANDDKQIEFPSQHVTFTTYDTYAVFSYGRYGRGSVLAGRTRRTWLDDYPTLAEARAAHPTASITDSAADARAERGS